MTNQIQQTITGDEQLVRAVLRGETPVFGVIVERYWNMIVALALTRMGDPTEAEDIAQESFMKAYSQLHTLKNPSRFAGWLTKIALQQCSDALRKQVRRKNTFERQKLISTRLDSITAYSSNPGLTEEQIHFVRETVGKLPEKFQNLILMRFMGGLTATQIAKQLNKRPGTIRVSLHRAYKLLRQDLAPLLEEVTL